MSGGGGGGLVMTVIVAPSTRTNTSSDDASGEGATHSTYNPVLGNVSVDLPDVSPTTTSQLVTLTEESAAPVHPSASMGTNAAEPLTTSPTASPEKSTGVGSFW